MLVDWFLLFNPVISQFQLCMLIESVLVKKNELRKRRKTGSGLKLFEMRHLLTGGNGGIDSNLVAG